jgi:hypothetical protein
MRIELDDDATRASEKAAGQLGMSVNAYVNWLTVSVAKVEILEAATITIKPEPPVQSRPRIFRTRKTWAVNL